jgi:hypothetical protein
MIYRKATCFQKQKKLNTPFSYIFKTKQKNLGSNIMREKIETFAATELGKDG